MLASQGRGQRQPGLQAALGDRRVAPLAARQGELAPWPPRLRRPPLAASLSIQPTIAFTGTVSFSFTTISVSTPEAGAGISASTLSVEISKRGSSRSTRVPTFFSHLVTVPSATLSPIWGMMTLVGMRSSR